MATKSEKTERRWIVVKSILRFMLFYAIAIILMHLYGMKIEPLNVLTSLIFGSSTVAVVGNWMTKPVEDD